MLALAITGLHAAASSIFDIQSNSDTDWIELTNIGSKPITFDQLYLKVKTGPYARGYAVPLNCAHPKTGACLVLKPRARVLLVAGPGKPLGYLPGPDTTTIRLGEKCRILNPDGDVVAVYQSEDDCKSHRMPLAQVTFTREPPKVQTDVLPDIPF